MSTMYSLYSVRSTYMDFDLVVKEPFRATHFHSPGRKPWVMLVDTFIEPQRGGTSET